MDAATRRRCDRLRFMRVKTEGARKKKTIKMIKLLPQWALSDRICRHLSHIVLHKKGDDDIDVNVTSAVGKHLRIFGVT